MKLLGKISDCENMDTATIQETIDTPARVT